MWSFIRYRSCFSLIFAFALLSPLGLYSEGSSINQLQNKVQKQQSLMDTYEQNLISCRDICINQCRMRCAPDSECSCSFQLCDKRDCNGIKTKYNNVGNTLEQLKIQLAKAGNQEGTANTANPHQTNFMPTSPFTSQSNNNPQGQNHLATSNNNPNPGNTEANNNKQNPDNTKTADNNEVPGNNNITINERTSIVDKLKDKRKKMKRNTLLGAAVSAGLWLRAKHCCKPSAPCNSQCKMWIGAAGAATAATGYMAGQAKAFKNSEELMCTGGQCTYAASSIGNSGPGTENPNPTTANNNIFEGENIELPDSCAENPRWCEEIFTAIKEAVNSTPDCPPGDTSCLTQTTSPNLLSTSLGDDITKQLLKTFQPEDGWPQEALTGAQNFSYDQMNPKEKQAMNRLLNEINRKNKNFLPDPSQKVPQTSSEGLASLDSSGFNFGGTDSLSPLDLSSNSASSEGKNTADSFAQNKGRQPTSPDYGADESISDNIAGSNQGKSDLGRQMRQMLKEFEDSNGKDPFAGKTIDFGSDLVGVAEDNIFMMTHRQHRSMDNQGTFIKI